MKYTFNNIAYVINDNNCERLNQIYLKYWEHILAHENIDKQGQKALDNFPFIGYNNSISKTKGEHHGYYQKGSTLSQ